MHEFRNAKVHDCSSYGRSCEEKQYHGGDDKLLFFFFLKFCDQDGNMGVILIPITIYIQSQ